MSVRASFAEAERLAARCKPELRDTFAYCYVRECFRDILDSAGVNMRRSSQVYLVWYTQSGVDRQVPAGDTNRVKGFRREH